MEKMKHPAQLATLEEVVRYWEECLALLDEGKPETSVASQMVGVITSPREVQWSQEPGAHPPYQLIFELAASLELPEHMTGHRHERWQCIRALLPVLRKAIAEAASSDRSPRSS